MNRYLHNWLQEPDTIELIDTEQWDRFYRCLHQDRFIENNLDNVGEVTDLLIDCGATFEGMLNIPQGFACSSKQTQFTIPESVNYIEDQAFLWSNLTSIVIPETVNGIGEWAFAECKNLKTIYILNPNITMSSDSFEDTILENVYFAGTEEEFENLTFYPAKRDYRISYNYKPL